MIILMVLRAFVVSLYVAPLFAAWNYSIRIELVDSNIQDISIGIFYPFPYAKTKINNQATMRLGYHVVYGCYILDKSVLLFPKKAND